MAACLITVSGTIGTVRIDYIESLIPKNIIVGIGTIYLESTITNVTYTNLSGDAIASSLCLTVTNLPTTCFNMFWKIKDINYKIDALIFNNVIIPIAEVNFPYSDLAIINQINNLNDSRFKITKYLISNLNAIYNNDPSITISHSYILQIQGTTIPQFRVKNTNNTGYIYIHGVSSSCTPVGYIDVNICETVIPL